MGDSWKSNLGDKFTRGARKNHKARKHEFENEDDEFEDDIPNYRKDRKQDEDNVPVE